jgi:hypothetical protein
MGYLVVFKAGWGKVVEAVETQNGRYQQDSDHIDPVGMGANPD